MKPWLDDGDVQLYHGDVREALRELPAASVQTIVTSPPYWGLRTYETGAWLGGDPGHDHAGMIVRQTPPGSAKQASNQGANDVRSGDCVCGARRVDEQLGMEPTPELYVEHMVSVFAELRRVLRDDGTAWLNLGDSYASSAGGGGGPASSSTLQGANQSPDRGRPAPRPRGELGAGLKQKDLVGIPWRVAFALQADGWYLRCDVIWSKPNPMPESVSDRPTRSHEYLFLLAKRARYFYDADAIREPFTGVEWIGRRPTVDLKVNGNRNDSGSMAVTANAAGRNKRSVWELVTQPTPDAHFATFPEALVAPCIQAGTSEHGECSQCGAAWRRVVELVGGQTTGRTSAQAEAGAEKGIGHARYPVSGSVGQYQAEHHTRGWAAGCACDARRRSQTVLDPFIGSGTTAHVARELGRRCVGIDLSEAYLGIARRRLAQLSLVADAELHQLSLLDG